MKNSQELDKCKKIIDSAIKGYLGMLERKALLEQSILHAKHMINQLEPNLSSSVKTIQDTLYASLIIDIYAWLFDKNTNKNSSNLSAYQLLVKLKNPARTDFRDTLESYYVEPPATISLGNDTNQFCHESYKDEKSKEFEGLVEDCINAYKDFLDSNKRIEGIRNKLLAHKEGVYSTENNGHYVGEAINAVEKMRTIVLSLNKLIQKCSYSIDDEEKTATKKAELFWQHLLHR